MMSTTKSAALTSAQREIAELFLRSGGCVREPNEERRSEGHRTYKKGWEVRFNASAKSEAITIHALLERAGLTAGRPYRKAPGRWILPLYGRDSVKRFLSWVKELE